MESRGEIPTGSAQKLRKESKLAQKADIQAVKFLINATRHVIDLDSLLPGIPKPPSQRQDDDLTKLPVLIATADEERKQCLGYSDLAVSFCD